MEEEKMYVPSGLKTKDGKDIMCYTGAFYLKNKEKIERMVKKGEEILRDENKFSEKQQKDNKNIVKEENEKYETNAQINKKHDKLFKEILSDKKEAVNFINHYLNLNLLEDDIEKYEKEFRTEELYNIEADVVYKIKNKNVFILIEHQSSVDLKMSYRILSYKNAIVDSAIDRKRLREKSYKIPKVIAMVLYTGKRQWHKLSIKDIEEQIEGYEENAGEYKLIDVNEFSREELLEDNLITSKAMLIEKSQNKEELYKNIEDVINIQKKNEKFENLQLEKLVQYELAGTEDKEIISKFIEKIKNVGRDDETMTNASRIINREIRKSKKEGIEIGWNQGIIRGKEEGKIEGKVEGKAEGKAEGIALVAKRLKGKMHIKDISQITGLSEKEIEQL